MHAYVRSLTALAGGVVAFAVTATTVVPAAAAVRVTPRPITPAPYYVGGYVPSGTAVTAASQWAKVGTYAAEALPDTVDLRTNAPPVGDQGNVGSCVAWSIGYSIMGYYAKTTPGTGAPYAPLYLYMRSKRGAAPKVGLVPEVALNEAQKNGVDTQSNYFQGSTDYTVAPTTAEIANASSYRVSGWSTLWSGVANQGSAGQLAIERALAAGKPVALGFPVFADFTRLKGSTVYNTLSGTALGGHMVAAYGYDSRGVHIRNSWSTGWGANGDAKLSWAFVNKLVSAAFTVSGVSTPATAAVPAPSVVALLAKTGSALGGNTVTISGTGLAAATNVRFGTTEATFITASSNGATRLVATVPAHAAGTVDVTVTNPTGVSVATAASKYTYLAPAPTVTTLSPGTGTTYTATPVVVTGGNFTGASAVTVGGTRMSFTRVSATELRLVLPKHPAGIASIQVTTPSGTSTTSQASQFTWVAPATPTLASSSATTGTAKKATTVTLTGTGFTDASGVLVGTTSVRPTVLSNTKIQVTLPAKPAGLVTLRVVTPGGTSNTVPFTFV